MGGRLSIPQGPDGVYESSKMKSVNPATRLTRNRGIVNGRTIMAPLAAITMAGLLFVYARTSIRAAKLNAQKHREADGGQISWHRENMRRHGQLEKVEDQSGTLREALMADVHWKKNQHIGVKQGNTRTERSTEEERLRKMLGKNS